MIDREKIQLFDKNILNEILGLKNPVLIKKHLDEYGLEIVDKKILPKEEYKDLYKDVQSYWDKKQLVKKINLE